MPSIVKDWDSFSWGHMAEFDFNLWPQGYMMQLQLLKKQKTNDNPKWVN